MIYKAIPIENYDGKMIDSNIQWSETTINGISYEDLVAIVGEPTSKNDPSIMESVNFEWVVPFGFEGKIHFMSIFDKRDPKCNCGHNKDKYANDFWYLGGSSEIIDEFTDSMDDLIAQYFKN